MKRNYTRRERAAAIEACALMASSCEQQVPSIESHYFGDAIDTESAAAELARQALWSFSAADARERWAEAECLLREGWRPGDKITRRETSAA